MCDETRPRRHEDTKERPFIGLRVFVAMFAFLTAAISAQQPTFRSGTKLVVQTVNVKDKDGKPVEGLTARDFVVIEDGEPQAVSFVEYQRLDNTPAA
jgi:hypothetical protein